MINITNVYLNSGATLRRSGVTPATPEAMLGIIRILNFFTTKLSPTDFWCLKCVYISSQSLSRHTLEIIWNNVGKSFQSDLTIVPRNTIEDDS